jgi:hypothetical protein
LQSRPPPRRDRRVALIPKHDAFCTVAEQGWQQAASVWDRFRRDQNRQLVIALFDTLLSERS